MNSYYAVIKIAGLEETKFVDACTVGDARDHLYLIGATEIISIQKL